MIERTQQPSNNVRNAVELRRFNTKKGNLRNYLKYQKEVTSFCNAELIHIVKTFEFFGSIVHLAANSLWIDLKEYITHNDQNLDVLLVKNVNWVIRDQRILQELTSFLTLHGVALITIDDLQKPAPQQIASQNGQSL